MGPKTPIYPGGVDTEGGEMSDDLMFAAALATTLKNECERQHARAEQAKAECYTLRAEVARLRDELGRLRLLCWGDEEERS